MSPKMEDAGVSPGMGGVPRDGDARVSPGMGNVPKDGGCSRQAWDQQRVENRLLGFVITWGRTVGGSPGLSPAPLSLPGLQVSAWLAGGAETQREGDVRGGTLGTPP